MKPLFLILLFPLCAKAQVNPGFMGIRDVMTISAQVHPWLALSAYKFAPSLNFSYEHSFSRTFSLGLSYTGYKSKMTSDYMMLSTGESTVSVMDNSQYKNVHFMGVAVSKHNAFTLHLKKYLGSLGAIAPVGTYISLDIGSNNWKIKKQDYYGEDADGIKYEDKDEPEVAKMVIVGFTIGTRRMLSEHIGLVLTSAFSYPMSSNIAGSVIYTGPPESLHELVHLNEARAARIRGIMQFGMGISYNL